MLGVNEGVFMLTELHRRQQLAEPAVAPVSRARSPTPSARCAWWRAVGRRLVRRGPDPAVEPVGSSEAARGGLASARPSLRG